MVSQGFLNGARFISQPSTVLLQVDSAGKLVSGLIPQILHLTNKQTTAKHPDHLRVMALAYNHTAWLIVSAAGSLNASFVSTFQA